MTDYQEALTDYQGKWGHLAIKAKGSTGYQAKRQ